MPISPFCRGDGCPQKETCERYKSDINMKRDDYLASVPWDVRRKKCEFYLGLLPGSVWHSLQDILKENRIDKPTDDLLKSD